mmetsp:Transcript_7217/g.20473  ORF Transcript_7217/g.20473 Transcript_7217/m.20473 type:complete len:258 (+) Transcript_7217:206-979(+)
MDAHVALQLESVVESVLKDPFEFEESLVQARSHAFGVLCELLQVGETEEDFFPSVVAGGVNIKQLRQHRLRGVFGRERRRTDARAAPSDPRRAPSGRRGIRGAEARGAIRTILPIATSLPLRALEAPAAPGEGAIRTIVLAVSPFMGPHHSDAARRTFALRTRFERQLRRESVDHLALQHGEVAVESVRFSWYEGLQQCHDFGLEVPEVPDGNDATALTFVVGMGLEVQLRCDEVHHPALLSGGVRGEGFVLPLHQQ